MTRLWIGVGLLLILAICGIVLNLYTVPFHEALAADLDLAADLAAEGNWEQARQITFAARDRWQKRQNSFAAMTDHEPMEQMEALFRELSLMHRDQTSDFTCVCVHLAQTARAIGETQALKWWGIL